MGLSCVVLGAEKPTFQKLDAEGIEGIAKARELVDAFAVATAAFDGEDHVRTGTSGKFGDRSDSLDARQGAQAGKQAIEQIGDLRRGFVCRARKCDSHAEHVLRLEARVGFAGSDETTEQQSGG